jgi:hypothetical protein
MLEAVLLKVDFICNGKVFKFRYNLSSYRKARDIDVKRKSEVGRLEDFIP